jgi:hypothetical protein
MISAHTPKNSNSLKVVRNGGSVPQSAVFDLKTRSIKKKGLNTTLSAQAQDTTLSEQMPRLWVRQIPFFVLAYHNRGRFEPDEIKVHNIEANVARWESDNKQDVCKLIALITKIADIVKSTQARKLEIRYQCKDELELRHQVEGVAPVLPVDLATQWADQGNPAELISGGGPENGPIREEADRDKENVDDSDEDEYDWDKQEDYTACSSVSCNYCGRCSY